MKNKKGMQMLCGVLCSGLVVTGGMGALQCQASEGGEDIPTAQETLQSIAAYYGVEENEILTEAVTMPVDSTSDWLAIAAAEVGMDQDYENYLQQVTEYIVENYQDNCLDPARPTEGQRLTMVVQALGGNPEELAEGKDGEVINLLADSTYNWSGSDSFDTQGLNAWIYALNAENAGEYIIPDEAPYSKQVIIEKLVSSQNEDGGFGLTVGSSDVDLTAMTLTALSKYADQEAVGMVIERGLNYLSTQQTEKGGFLCMDTENSESASQVIIALSSLGIDATTDERFQKSEGGVVEAFLSYRLASGMFCHTTEDGVEDLMATEQATLALLSMEKFQNGEGSIYDLSNLELNSVANAGNGSKKEVLGISSKYMVIGLGALLVVLILLEIRQISRYRKAKRKSKKS